MTHGFSFVATLGSGLFIQILRSVHLLSEFEKFRRKLERNASSAIMLMLVLAGMLAAAMIGVVKAVETIVAVYPQAVTAYVDSTFAVNITIADVTDLWSWGLKLEWNSSVLGFVDAEEGPFLKSIGSTSWIPIVLQADLIFISCTSMVVPIEGVSGSGVLATITFNATELGDANLTMSEVDLEDVDGNHISCTVVNGQVIVTWVGDLDGDGDVDPWDGIYFVDAFVDYWTSPVGQVTDPDYWSCDLDGDGDVDPWDGIAFVDAFVEYWS